jgi:hypothetical protein
MMGQGLEQVRGFASGIRHDGEAFDIRDVMPEVRERTLAQDVPALMVMLSGCSGSLGVGPRDFLRHPQGKGDAVGWTGKAGEGRGRPGQEGCRSRRLA